MILRKLRHLRTYCTETKKPFYVTTPIFYVNAAPHIGHMYSAVIADAMCRYQRLKEPNSQVLLCTGTDENGIKVQQAAAQHGKPVAQYCDEISARYRELFQAANIAQTDFIRTTEDRHKKAVAHFWQCLKKGNHIYTAQYSGWYCVSDETFLTDSQLRLDEATGKRYSIESGHPVEWSEEQNYMFRLSARQDDVLYWLKQGNQVRPQKFEKILFDMLSEPLPDVSISRPINRVQWAIPVPDDQAQTVYVWLDALINYLTSAGYPDEKYKSQWPPNVQIIGKDILKFHGIYWPAFLIAAGLEPPSQLFVHSHWTVNDEKMSKSKNNVVNPIEAAKVYTMEGLRYFLLREGVAHSDGNYSDTKALRILNSELADTLGNLLSRACAKSLNPQQIYPRLHAVHLKDILLRLDAARHLQEALQQLEGRCAKHYDDNNFYLVVDTVMATLHAANNFFENSRPWELKSGSKTAITAASEAASVGAIVEENAQRLETIIAMTMDALRLCSIVLQPIVPELSGRLLDKLNVPEEQRLWQNLKQSFATVATQSGISGGCGLPAHTHTQPQLETTARTLRNMDVILFRRILLPEQSQQHQSNTKDATIVNSKKNQKNLKQSTTTKTTKKKKKQQNTSTQ